MPSDVDWHRLASTGVEAFQQNQTKGALPMKKRLAAILKWLGIFILALAVIYAGLMIWSARKLRQAYAALEKDGRPMTLAQLIPSQLKDTENAAPVYQAAILLLKSKSVKDSKQERQTVFGELGNAALAILKGSSQAETDAAFKTLRKWLQDPVVVQIFHEIEMATAKPCQYDLDYAKGGALKLPHLSDNQWLLNILCAKSRLQAADGDAAGAWDTVICSFRLADASKNEPIAISQYCRIKHFAICLDNLQQLARTSLPPPAQKMALDEMLEKFDSSKSLVLCLDSQRLYVCEWVFTSFKEMTGILGICTMRGGPSKGPVKDCWTPHSPIGIFAIYASPLAKYDQAVYMDLYRRYTKVAEQSYSPENLRQLEAFENSIPRCCFWSRGVSGFYILVERFTQFRAQAVVTRAGLAILLYKQAKGTYPKSLEDAGLKDAIDPYSQKPLIYKLTEKGFLLYSIGENQKDDGGNNVVFQDGFPPDIAWIFQIPQVKDSKAGELQ
jgi:hypothetical protein